MFPGKSLPGIVSTILFPGISIPVVPVRVVSVSLSLSLPSALLFLSLPHSLSRTHTHTLPSYNVKERWCVCVCVWWCPQSVSVSHTEDWVSVVFVVHLFQYFYSFTSDILVVVIVLRVGILIGTQS